jgi:hypothetical protein
VSEDWERKIGMADMHGTVATVNYSPPDSEGDAYTSVSLTSGAASIHAAPTPGALRQLAAAMLDAADAMDKTTA